MSSEESVRSFRIKKPSSHGPIVGGRLTVGSNVETKLDVDDDKTRINLSSKYLNKSEKLDLNSK